MRITDWLFQRSSPPEDSSEEVRALHDELRESERVRLQAIGDVQKHRDLLRDILAKVGPVELSPAEQRRNWFLVTEYRPDGAVVLKAIPVTT